MQIKLLRKNAVIPTRAKPGDAGFDICACIDKPIILLVNECVLIPTGFAVHIGSEADDMDDQITIAGLIIPRSGLGHKNGIILGNSVGLIDSGYHGEWMVSAWNRSDSPFTIEPGMKLCQAIFIPCLLPKFEVVESFGSETDRGEGGFGHTGVI